MHYYIAFIKSEIQNKSYYSIKYFSTCLRSDSRNITTDIVTFIKCPHDWWGINLDQKWMNHTHIILFHIFHSQTVWMVFYSFIWLLTSLRISLGGMELMWPIYKEITVFPFIPSFCLNLLRSFRILVFVLITFLMTSFNWRISSFRQNDKLGAIFHVTKDDTLFRFLSTTQGFSKLSWN